MTDPDKKKPFKSPFFGSELNRVVANAFSQLQINIANSVKMNPAFLKSMQKIASDIKRMPDQLLAHWSAAAKLGWYPNGESSISIIDEVNEGQDALDAFMMNHIRSDWKKITEHILSNYPDRNEIISCAIRLHEQNNYIAAIPLFFSQADGICAQHIGAHLFADKKERENKISALYAKSTDFTGILLQLLGMKTQVSARIKESSVTVKKLSPNRHGILHGSEQHLDYGTELNSFKAFSLLAFVAFVLSGENQDESGQ